MKSLFLSLGIGVLAAFASDTANRSGADGFALGGVDSPELPFVDERGAWCDVVDVDGMPWSVSVFEEADGDETARVGVSGILRAVPEFATGDVLVPSEIAGVEVVGIDDFAFQGCSNLVSVTVPDGVTHVGDFAFHGCDALVSLSLPCTATNLSPMAFFGCPVEPEFREDAQTGQDRKSAVAGSVRAVKTSRLAAVSSGGGDAMCVVSFDANGGSVEKTSETFPSGEPLGRLPIPTRDGYVFEGWYDSPIPGVGTLVTTQTVAPGIVLSLYARWVLPDTDPWQPVFRFYSKNYKGHFYTMDQAECAILMCTNPNWKYEGVAYYAAKTRLEGTVPLHRFYSKNYRGHFYTIDEAEMQTVRDTNPNWKYEGGAFYVYPDAASAPEGVGTPIYRFWSKSYRHHFFTISETEMRTIRESNPNWAYEGVAFWTQAAPPEILRYDVLLDGNGATSGATAPFSAVIGRLSTLPENGFVRPGWTFAGWATNANGLAVWQPGDTVYLNLATEAGTAVTLYAAWAGASFTVAFDANAAGAVGTMPPQAFVYGTPQPLRANAFQLDGHSFEGWSATPDGLVAYTDGQTVANLGTEAGETVTLYARWTAGTFTVLFDANGGVGEMPDQTFTWGLSQPLSANAFSLAGSSFAGWARSPTGAPLYGDRQTVSNLAEVGSGVRLYASWTQNGYAVRFNPNGGAGAMDVQDFVAGQAQNLLPNAFSLAGHAFAGWSLAPGGTVRYADRELVANLGTNGSTVDLHAVWTPVPYSVGFNPNGGTGWMEPQPFVYGVSAPLSGCGYALHGHSFSGWALSPTGPAVYADGATVSNLASAAGATVYLHATWSPNPYAVRFNKNATDATGSMPDESFAYGTAQVLAANAFSRTGYTFYGWATSATGAKAYDDGQSVLNLASDSGATVNLYALWTPNAYSVRFNKNATDAVGSMPDESFTYGTAKAITANAFVRPGYTVSGWATSATGAKVYNDKQSVSNLTATAGGTVTLFAVWTPDLNDKVQLWEGGLYWATKNIGAENLEDYGLYFWWGDTVGYRREGNAWVASDGSSSNFLFGSGNTPTYNKSNSTLQSEGWITSAGVLAPEHDAAHVHWGDTWRMPTKDEISALNDNCDWTWTTRNGANGYVVRGRGAYSSASIFLPAAGLGGGGFGDGTSLYRAGSLGYYWSSVPVRERFLRRLAPPLRFRPPLHELRRPESHLRAVCSSCPRVRPVASEASAFDTSILQFH